MIRNFITALQFLTVFRVKRNHRIEEGDLAKSMAYFPLVGFLIGLILVYADRLFTAVALPHAVGNFLLIIISLLVTRALHLDGLADTFDGIMGGSDPASRLAIMKDSRVGTAGVLAVIIVVLLKYLCLNNLYNSEKVAALLTVPLLGRWSQTLMVYRSQYGREQGMGKAFVGHLRFGGLVAASIAACGLASFVIVREDVQSAVLAASVVVGVAALTLLGKRYLARKLGGLTGDAVGAVSELSEVLVFLLFVMLSVEV